MCTYIYIYSINEPIINHFRDLTFNEEINTNNLVLIYLGELIRYWTFQFSLSMQNQLKQRTSLGTKFGSYSKTAIVQQVKNSVIIICFPFSYQNFNKTHNFFKLLGE